MVKANMNEIKLTKRLIQIYLPVEWVFAVRNHPVNKNILIDIFLAKSTFNIEIHLTKYE